MTSHSILKKKIFFDMGCKEVLNSEHLLTCEAIYKEETILKFKNILKCTMKQKVSIIKKIQENAVNSAIHRVAESCNLKVV